ncbi:MAG: RHS repeat-associated core domain-containing protein, partial [Hyphomicrobium sp.]
HNNWHRHYDPTIGRYMQPDPLGFVDGPSVYAYARNSPLEWIDPTGLQTPDPPKPPIVIDPRTGEQIYPPKMTETKPGTLHPPPLPPQPPKATCEGFLQACMAQCTKSPACKANKGVDLLCRGACLAQYYFCKKKVGE